VILVNWLGENYYQGQKSMIYVFLVETTNKGKYSTTNIDSFCFYVYNNLKYPFKIKHN
jgi:hypothetical protein